MKLLRFHPGELERAYLVGKEPLAGSARARDVFSL
jgi:hypothetical protein